MSAVEKAAGDTLVTLAADAMLGRSGRLERAC